MKTHSKARRKRKQRVAASEVKMAEKNTESTEGNKVIGIIAVFGLLIALSFTIIYAGRGTTGAAVASTTTADASDHNMDGFSSYDEMMKAHHPDQQASGGSADGGCGGVPTGGHESPVVGSGEMSSYDITYDNAGYDKLLEAAKTISLNKEQTKLIVGRNIELSCCGVKMLQASGNCECGHHVALFGLAKLLASKGYTAEDIQSEIDKWKLVFFPEGGSGNTGGC